MVGQVTFPVPPEPEPEPPPELEVPPPGPVVGGGVEVVEVVGLEAVPPQPERKRSTVVARGKESRRRRNKEHLGKWMCKKMRIACAVWLGTRGLMRCSSSGREERGGNGTLRAHSDESTFSPCVRFGEGVD